MIKFLTHAGKLCHASSERFFRNPKNLHVYYKQTMREFMSLGLNSIGIVAIVSFFMGAAITLQTAYNTENPIYPKYLIGLGCRDSIILEFSSTIAALILAGKVGSNIASEIGTMRVTEQIDALGNHGSQFGFISYSAQTSGNIAIQSISYLDKYLCGNTGRMACRYSTGCNYHRKFHLWYPVCIYTILYYLLAYKDCGFCFYYYKRFRFSGLLCFRRFPRSRTGKHKSGRLQQRSYSPFQCYSYAAFAIMISVKNLYKSFNGRTVLNDISVTFEPGKTNLIIGQSGSGKTVLLKSIVGLHEIDSGEIWFEDKLFNKLDFREKKEIRKEMGMLFQGSALFDSLTVEQNVRFPLDMFTDKTPEEKTDRVNFCLNRVNIMNSNELFPAELSGGMRKRVAIARAISLNPNTCSVMNQIQVSIR